MAVVELKRNGKMVSVKIMAPEGAAAVGRVIAPGQTAMPGDIVSLPEDDASYLVQAGTAVLATKEDIAAAKK